MAADTIIIKYKADTTKFSQDVKGLTGDLNKVEVAGVKAGDKTAASFNKAATAVNKTDKQTKQTTSAFNGMGASLTNIASSMGIAFGVQQVIQFGKASAEAFIDAEKNAQLLLFALKGNEAAQGRLMAQASELQNTTIFDDDSIQQAQTFLANQGRTEEQIKKVINAAVELSTVTGVDLQTAVMQLDGTFEGNIGKMGKLDSAFKGLTKEQLANGAAADLLIEKYGGTAKAMGDTTAGQVAKLKNQFGELQETVGGELIGFVSGLTEAFNGLLELNPEKFFKNIAISQFASFVYDSIAGTDKLTESLTDFEKKAIEIGNATDDEIRAKFEALGGATNATAVEFKKFTDEMRSGILQQTLEGLSSVLDINEKQFKELTDQTDKYGISVRVTSEAILGLKNATEEQLLVTFLNAQAALGVTREDFDKYVGTIKGIKPLQDDLGKSTTALVGPYQQLTNAVSQSMTKLQDLAALFQNNKTAWTDVTNQALLYANAQNMVVAANDLVTQSLKRTTTEGLIEYGEAMNFVMVQEDAVATRFKMTDDQLMLRNEIFQELGVNQIDTYQNTLKQLYKLQEAEISSTNGTLEEIYKVTAKYTTAISVLQLQQASQTMGAMGELAGALSSTLSAIFGDAAQKNAEFAGFIQTLTITEILFKQGAAIANSIEKITGATNPFDVIAGIAGIIAAIGGVFSGIMQTVQGTNIPDPPSFFKGTDSLQLNGNPKGIDTIPIMAHEGEAIIPTDRNKSEPGLAKAWIGGNLDKYIIDKWVSPALVAQEKQINKDFANDIATSMLLQQGGSFDDYRMRLLMMEGNNINRAGLGEIANKITRTSKRRGGYA
jgi:hypothetical protein